VVEDYKAWRSSTPVNRNGYPVADVRQADRQGAASKTLQLEVQTIGAFFRYAVRLGLVEENPVARIRGVRVVSKAPVYLDEEEIPRFLDAARTFDQWARPQRQCGTLFHDIFLVYLKTGMRLEELRHLEWSDVDLRRGEITIRPEKEVKEDREIPLSAAAAGRLRRMGPAGFARLSLEERQDLLGRRLQSPNQLGELQFGDFDLKKGILRRRSKVNWNPKTRGRAIPISAKLAGLLAGLPKGSNLVFPDPNGGGMWRFRVNDLVKRCARQAGITKNIHTHTLRHTFATQLRQRGVPLETIKELLGHADIRETLIYAHFSPEEARAAIPKIDFF
jgi:integrase/recombinase XerD